MNVMSRDAKYLHRLVKHRAALIKSNETKARKEKNSQLSNIDKIREENSKMRNAKNEAKELDRQKISRTLMANLVTAADYPDSPKYVHHLINVLKNILGISLKIYFYVEITKLLNKRLL